MSKPFWQSKTFWVNLIVLAIGIVKLIMPELPIPAAHDAILGVAILNIVLRSITTGAIDFGGTTLVQPQYGQEVAKQAALEANKVQTDAQNDNTLSDLGKRTDIK